MARRKAAILGDGARPAATRARQVRAQDRCRAISEAASKVIASHGIAGLTHRLVAGQAGVPLAATTYHFESKADIIRAATQAVLEGYDQSFARARERFRKQGGSRGAFLDFFTDLMQNTAGRARLRATCWGEIMLDMPRHPANLDMTRNWFGRLVAVWEDIIATCGVDRPAERAIVATDALIGLLLLVVGLGLDDRQIGKIIAGHDLLDFRPAVPGKDGAGPARTGAKAAATRDKILSATIDILKAEGPGAVNRRTVAESANLSKAAAFYYFDSVPDLLVNAQQTLFQRSKERYRRGLSEFGGSDADFEHLIDRTATVFLREVTEYSSDCVANYSIWLRADQEPLIRAMVWEVTADQHISWRNVLGRWKQELNPFDPLLAQALFLGKLTRILATGSRIEDLAAARREFAFALNDIIAGNWAFDKNSTD